MKEEQGKLKTTQTQDITALANAANTVIAEIGSGSVAYELKVVGRRLARYQNVAWPGLD